MGQALYRKYRSKSLAELVGQEHITDTLTRALKAGRISHAYLFTGPRGVGKTSVARILAHEINQLPYTDGQTHLDIIEIDAASNRRIDEIRDLRDKVYIAPAQTKYKVYIIDEVHMLTREAFNALLKTLEEPPAHAVFILATTEAHKLPETIVSRTQRFIFRPIDTAKAAAHLRTIAQQEHIDITDEALTLLAEHGGGSFRDSISLLDQASGQDGRIEAATIQTMLGIPPAQAISELCDALTQATLSPLIGSLSGLYDQGYQAAAIAKQLGSLLRNQLVHNQLALPRTTALALLTGLLDVATAHDPERYLELTLLAALPADNTALSAASVPIAKTSSKSTAMPHSPANDTAKAASTPVPPPKPPEPQASQPRASAASSPPAPVTSSQPFDDTAWNQVLGALKKQYNTLYGIVRMAKPQLVEPNTVELAFAFAFHQKRVSEAKNQKILADTLATILGQPMEIRCLFEPGLKGGAPAAASPSLPPVPSANPAAPGEPLSAISNIFGGGELLQS